MRMIFLNAVAISALALTTAVASAQGLGGGERGGAERGAPSGGAERGGNAGANTPREAMPKEGAGAAGAPPHRGADAAMPKGAEGHELKQGAEGTQRPESTEKGRGPGKNAAEVPKNGQTGPAHASNITPAQKTKVSTTIRTRINSEHVENIRNVNFAVNVGTIVPTRYHYYPLPPEVIEIVPEYQGYDFIYVDDAILILDPRTHEIVYIL